MHSEPLLKVLFSNLERPARFDNIKLCRKLSEPRIFILGFKTKRNLAVCAL